MSVCCKVLYKMANSNLTMTVSIQTPLSVSCSPEQVFGMAVNCTLGRFHRSDTLRHYPPGCAHTIVLCHGELKRTALLSVI